MKFSCADFTFPLLPHPKVLQLIRMLDIEAVDLGVFEGRSHNYPSQISSRPKGEAQRLAGLLAEAGLSIADIFLQTGAEPTMAAANSAEKRVREGNRDIFRRMLDFTLEIGGRHITGLPGVYHPGNPADDDWERACEEAAWRCQVAQELGVTYSVEPHVGSILPGPSETLLFLEAVPGLSLTLDYGHFIYQGLSNESVHVLCQYATHFHARGGAPGQLQSTVQDNQIDFAAALRELNRSDYRGYLCIEYVWVDWEGCNRTDNVSETLLLKQELEQLLRHLDD
jgi:sugar phosphate isomerase/epimerase